ncbi:putative ribosomal large subunit pseudouridine synthase SVR1, chloroplastic isoform X3 [Panicum virgatum]|uniref:putative ribosomal large subunit pseudouridine synthase SVR1, chloroplastic isoform X3 n=1 Tax=Panicum virgatum TaxID=38727 RepID=UPI0019D5C08E|nr:putative ribosomal large subunit pseudouridine synthase SVR1, chloroplastic isoform X3 [Panicum virgatum]
MALATAATAAAVSLQSLLTRPACVLRFGRRLPPHLLRATSSTSSAPDFNITFAEPAPAKKANASSPAPSAQPLVPWIVRGEDGKPRLSTSPPPEVLQAIALAEAEAKKAAKKESLKGQKGAVAAAAAASSAGVKTKERKAAPAAPPKFSKAARRFYNENIKEREPQRLAKVLAAAGVASRRTSEELIFQGKVTVNGAVCTSPQNKIQPGLPKPRLFTVGRLDVATTGLIIVTNDGEFAQKLAHPSSNVTKEYVVTIDGAVHKKHLIAISEGTKIDGVMCVPDLVEPLAESDTRKTRLKIVVHEGRNHEVRELVQNAGLKVYALKRVRIGRFRLPADLGIGKFVELKQADIKALEGNN